jgi:hypothetical protein
MNIQGNVVEVAHGVTIEKKNGGTYPGTRFTYRDLKGKLSEQYFHEKTLGFNGLQGSLDALSEKDDFTMVKEKDGEFWNVKSITKGFDEIAATQTSAASQGNSYVSNKSTKTFETPEERAIRQRLIVAQSSITAALVISGQAAKPFAEAKLLETAQTCYDWVFAHKEEVVSLIDSPDDIV